MYKTRQGTQNSNKVNLTHEKKIRSDVPEEWLNPEYCDNRQVNQVWDFIQHV